MPDYKLPFEAELGAHPTFEEMQLLVSRNKQRPLFHDVWKDSNQVGVKMQVPGLTACDLLDLRMIKVGVPVHCNL